MRLLRRAGLLLAAPALAIVSALLITSLVLLATGTDPWSVYSAMLEYADRPRTQALILNSATTYYFAALAVAIGFRMNLFNIGVDGQYRLAAMLSASLGGALVLPGPLSTLMIIVTAMLVGALWAGIAGVLKVYRGVSEVISTIMLNFVATGIVAYLLSPGRLAVTTTGSNNIGTKEIPESAWVPGLPLVPDSKLKVYGLVILAVLVGVAFWFVINRTRFGFDLRATGISEPAAIASGVDVRRMIVVSMLLSGAVAGLVGMPQLLGRVPHLLPGLPGRPRLHRDRDRAARPQRPGRDRDRLAAVGLPGQLGPDPRPGGRAQGGRADHPGRHRAVRGRGLRAGPPLPGRGPAARGRPRARRAARRQRSGRAGEGGAGVTALAEHPEAPGDERSALDRLRDRLRNRWVRLGLLFGFGLVVLSVVRVASGATDLTSAGTVGGALGLAVPIAMAGLGGLWSERAGVVNIGLEGMMIFGTFGAGWLGWQYGPWAGVAAGIALGALGGLIHAIATVTFGVDHIVSGVAINILGLGATQYLASIAFTGTPNGGATQSPSVKAIDTVSVPFINEPLQALERQHWFLLSDLAGILRGLLTNISLLTLVAVALVIGTYFVLWWTPFGLRLRSCGEDPYAAESLGVRVYLHKYIAVVVSGGLAGLGGAFLAIVAASIYREGQTAGRGYIGLAAMIFGNWRPTGLVAGAGLFGYTDALQLRNADAVHALLLLLAVLLLVYALVSGLRRRFVVAGIAAACGVGSLVVYLVTDSVPPQVTFITPYATTLLVLALASQRLRMPKADGLVYRRGQDH